MDDEVVRTQHIEGLGDVPASPSGESPPAPAALQAAPAPDDGPAPRAPKAGRVRSLTGVMAVRLVLGLVFLGIGGWRVYNALEGGHSSSQTVVICPPGFLPDGIGTECTRNGLPPTAGIDIPTTPTPGVVPSTTCPPGGSADPASPTFNVNC